jgi:hypothetical protein
MATTPTRESRADRVFESLLERQETLFDTIRSNNDRYHRFTRSLIEGARQDGTALTEVARRFVSQPTDIVGVYEAMSDAIGDSQARRLALAREWLDDLLETQRESREVVRQGLGDVREAVQRVQEGVPSAIRSAASRVRRNQKDPEPVAQK